MTPRMPLSVSDADPEIPARFSAPFAPPDEAFAAAFLAEPAHDEGVEAKISGDAARLVGAIRDSDSRLGSIEDMLHEYDLATREGVALMMLAEALLRVPDAATADRLIEDKIGQGDWSHHVLQSSSLLATASAWGLALAARIIGPRDTPRSALEDVARRLGAPALRAATRQAVRIVGKHFVLGETIEDALGHALDHGSPYSFDMLGEGARTAADAQRYLEAYSHAIRTVGASGASQLGVSVKLSALHPRYEALSRERVLRELTPRLIDLARLARDAGIDLTVDAEEADRLELSLDVIGAALRDGALHGYAGFGLAVQAYQKRAQAVLDHLAALAPRHGAPIRIRLVKGAYWDSEIKRAQERGLAGFPVFTRKAMTDLNYGACARKLFESRGALWPQFATHNALTVAHILHLAGPSRDFEFQRLHGMGEALYEELSSMRPELSCRIYAPVGSYRDLLAYLVRRLLENGANSSFVARVADPATDVSELVKSPRARLQDGRIRHPRIAAPDQMFAPRRNSRGVEFGSRREVEALLADIAPWRDRQVEAATLIDGDMFGESRACYSPIDGARIGAVRVGDADLAEYAMDCAAQRSIAWDGRGADARARLLEHAADLLEQRRGAFIALLQSEGGKTLDDAVSEIREAVDYCRYYAAQARLVFAERTAPGPTGERNLLRRRGRGVFVCISPWNFPLAIFLGQIAAALAAGNCVVAKPAEQTPLIAFEAVRLLLEAGVPEGVLHLVPGDGEIGAALVRDHRVAGVAFTGSTDVGRAINRALAAKDGPIVPLIAETGGVNAMIVDATALPEQVADDVIVSAFRSAGQRCSALRLLCVQEDIADKVIETIIGAAQELKLGDPREPATHVGPVIDADAHRALAEYVANLPSGARMLHAGAAPSGGLWFAPHIIEIKRASELQREVFGPVLHVVRWRSHDLDHREPGGLHEIVEDIDAAGYGLTLGVQSRIDETIAFVTRRLRTGNVYVNRSMIGAVVGSQPFGGNGLSGTGPKAGGADYLTRFSLEQTVCVNEAAAGGNVSLVAGPDH